MLTCMHKYRWHTALQVVESVKYCTETLWHECTWQCTRLSTMMCTVSGLTLLVLERMLKLYDMLVIAAGQGVHTCSLVACLCHQYA